MDHAVGLIHHNIRALGKDEDMPVDHVFEATGRRNDDVRTFTEVELLFFDSALETAGDQSDNHPND